MNTRLKQSDLATEYLSRHRISHMRIYRVWVTGPRHYEFPEFRSDYVGGVREAKREALKYWESAKN